MCCIWWIYNPMELTLRIRDQCLSLYDSWSNGSVLCPGATVNSHISTAIWAYLCLFGCFCIYRPVDRSWHPRANGRTYRYGLTGCTYLHGWNRDPRNIYHMFHWSNNSSTPQTSQPRENGSSTEQNEQPRLQLEMVILHDVLCIDHDHGNFSAICFIAYLYDARILTLTLFLHHRFALPSDWPNTHTEQAPTSPQILTSGINMSLMLFPCSSLFSYSTSFTLVGSSRDLILVSDMRRRLRRWKRNKGSLKNRTYFPRVVIFLWLPIPGTTSRRFTASHRRYTRIVHLGRILLEAQLQDPFLLLA